MGRLLYLYYYLIFAGFNVPIDVEFMSESSNSVKQYYLFRPLILHNGLINFNLKHTWCGVYTISKLINRSTQQLHG